MCKECLEKKISIFGRDHVDTISTVNCLANFYHKQGRYDESLNLHLECLERRKIILSENQPEALRLIYNIGVNYEQLGNFDEALTFFKDCYDRRCIVLGTHHVVNCAIKI